MEGGRFNYGIYPELSELIMPMKQTWGKGQCVFFYEIKRVWR